MILKMIRKPWLLMLNVFIYGVLLAMMGSCAHFSKVSPLVNFDKIKDSKMAFVVLQYDFIGLEKQEHSLFFRDSAGDLLEVDVPKNTDHEKAYVAELAGNRTYQLEAIQLGQESFLLKDLTQSFHLQKGKLNYLGAMNFELKDKDLIYSVVSPMKSLKKLKSLEAHLNIDVADLVNPYTGKNMRTAKSPTRVKLQEGRITNSFKNFVQVINPCYVEEWKTNPIILGQLDFQVTASNGVLRVKNLNSKHSASENFENCVWKRVSDTKIVDQNFRIKLPGVLYF